MLAKKGDEALLNNPNYAGELKVEMTLEKSNRRIGFQSSQPVNWTAQEGS